MIIRRNNHRGKYEKESISEQREVYKHYPGSHQVIIFIHGIIEGPKQFRRLVQIAYEEGYSVYVLLLPGHGESARVFKRAGYREWMIYVSSQIKRTKMIYDEIILVGHSMGALFSLCEAASFPEKIKAVVLIDTPLRIRLWPRVLIGAVRIKQGKVYDEYTKAERNAISIREIKGIDYIRWLIRYCELFSLIKFSKRQIAHLRQPVLLIFAKKDEFVCLKSKRYFYPKKELITEVILQDSGHFSYHHEDLIGLEESFRQFISVQKEVQR